MDPTKLAVGAGATVLAVGGSYGIYSLAFSKEPKFIVSPTDGKFGWDFRHHFVDASDDENNVWWENAFKNRYPKTPTDQELDTVFHNISSFSGLKSKCKEAYEKITKTEVSKDSGNEKYEKNVWELCSIDGVFPVAISVSNMPEDKAYKDESNSTSKIAGAKKSKLISVKDPKNAKFWRRQAEYFADKTNGLGKHASDSGAGFKAILDSNDGLEAKLKNKCHENYAGDYNSSSMTAKTKETLRFCSLQGKPD
ncbi:hypothetical protein [Candidatus Mycoplasma haematohominis]|uniref:Uncharacterized protein n=1 Tax=Candidatus Mycoplasma haematohominis TaxID=1494318 RepID=A0A478FPR5_9MOLU|nr:hypothetical protein [Candidatus Mycoplasma haemohominis]GCE63478.1 hypothetical protein MHSWG343_04750 [Candidatus Mycoplasma haemohominis]